MESAVVSAGDAREAPAVGAAEEGVASAVKAGSEPKLKEAAMVRDQALAL
jgi:hypothetical protein